MEKSETPAHCWWESEMMQRLSKQSRGSLNVRKVAEQDRGSKPVSSVPPLPLFQFVPPGSCLKLFLGFPQRWTVTCKPKPFPPQVGFGLGALSHHKNQTRTQGKWMKTGSEDTLHESFIRNAQSWHQQKWKAVWWSPVLCGRMWESMATLETKVFSNSLIKDIPQNTLKTGKLYTEAMSFVACE